MPLSTHVKCISIPSGMKQIGKWYSLLQSWLCLPQQLPDLEKNQLEREETDTANIEQRVTSKEWGKTKQRCAELSRELSFASQSWGAGYWQVLLWGKDRRTKKEEKRTKIPNMSGQDQKPLLLCSLPMAVLWVTLVSLLLALLASPQLSSVNSGDAASLANICPGSVLLPQH